MPLPRIGGGHIVLPSDTRYVSPSVTLYSTVCVSAAPPTVFKVMV